MVSQSIFMIHQHLKACKKAWVLFALIFLLSLLFPTPTYAYDNQKIEIITAKLELNEDGYRIFVTYYFELGQEVKQAINEGIPVVFTSEVEINRPRWYWFDEKTLSSKQSIKVQYDLWRRQYTVAYHNGLKQSFANLDEVMNLIIKPHSWLIGDKNALKEGKDYDVAVRIKLDSNQLSKPMLVNSFSKSDWRLASSWKRFVFNTSQVGSVNLSASVASSASS